MISISFQITTDWYNTKKDRKKPEPNISVLCTRKDKKEFYVNTYNTYSKIWGWKEMVPDFWCCVPEEYTILSFIKIVEKNRSWYKQQIYS